ncbi:PilW family protein [Sulfurisoma sediminicola]|uniref:Type IV pilus assembly protein PilW n=1 Tax=Sulfurisoma sediminicola TaxID=1381557 RepID=A0A497XAL1_9PROT|nr:PilW family protein [Sulfurisoma sediminicola]RLJ63585.1 type IV pilus assembly protein PilW [Sulfurisoma sediminicola]
MDKQKGFTLVEVMVGVVIALISMIAMFMVQENWDKQRSSITSGGDAQVAGSISAFNLERNLRNAGSGFGNSNFLGCTVSAQDAIGARNFSFTLAPVVITDGAGGLPDTISILAGNSNSPTATFEVASSTQTVTTMKDTRTGLSLGDLVILATPSPTTCRLAEISNLQPPGTNSGRETGHLTASYSRTSEPPENRQSGAAGACTGSAPGPWTCVPRYPSVSFTTFTSVPPAYGELRSLGDDPRLNVYAVDQARGALTRSELIHEGTTATDIGEGIINLQAQYGLDTNNDDIIDTWQATTPTWTQLRAVRFALLARGEHYESVAVTTAAPTWSGGTFAMRNVDGTADSGAGNLGVNNWRNYRYSVFEATVPLRNMIWRRFW